jgi:RimJ/RimL family protein N-acetyltransferase
MDDAVDLASHANNPKIAANLRDRFPHPYTLSDAESFLKRVNSQEPRTSFAIATASEPIGGVGLMLGQDVHHLTAELGYWLAESYWGKGVMTSALIAITEYGFLKFGLNRIYAEPYAPNSASMRVLEKAGFTFEGRLRASVVKNGKILDQCMFAKVRQGIT